MDGERRGATPVTLELTSVSHEIEIRQAGVAVERALLTPRPGFPQKLERTLTQLDETSGGGFAKTLQTSLSQELKLIPAGEFVMGSSRRDAYRRSNEPLRAVRVTHAFYLGAREVTNAEFRAFRPDHDSGTSAEMGYVVAQGKPCIGITDDHRFLNNLIWGLCGEGQRIVHNLDDLVPLVTTVAPLP